MRGDRGDGGSEGSAAWAQVKGWGPCPGSRVLCAVSFIRQNTARWAKPLSQRMPETWCPPQGNTQAWRRKGEVHKDTETWRDE